MDDIDAAFRLKAEELLKLLVASQRNLAPEILVHIRALFEQAKTVYKDGRADEALILVVQAIQAIKKT